MRCFVLCLHPLASWRLSTPIHERLFGQTVFHTPKGPVQAFLWDFGFIRAIPLNPRMKFFVFNNSGGFNKVLTDAVVVGEIA